MPIRTGQVTSDFGWRIFQGRRDNHMGLDVGARRGTPIRASGDGVVIFAGWDGGYGNLVKIRHGDGTITYYAHCRKFDVRRGQRVRAGQQIATVNSTGRSTGDHLHFGVQRHGRFEDPRRYFRFPRKGERL